MRAHTFVSGGALLALTLAAAPLVAAPLAAQEPASLDRNVVPPPGPPPALVVPTWTTQMLPNGARLVVTPKHDLPLVSFTIAFIGGSDNFEPADKPGVASLTAQMLSEGTASLTGEQLSDAEQMLGTTIRVGVGDESGSIGFTALSDKLEPALKLLADMLVHPSLPPDALERLRGQMLVNLAQARDRPEAIASRVFSKVVYGDEHPYGRVLTEASVKSITRDDIVAFHHAYFQPGRAVITVAGDVDPATVKNVVTRVFDAWPAGGAPPDFAYPAPPSPRPTTIYLVDKPKAAQSIFAIGLPGPPRNTSDYYAIEVMNTILGGLFQSRLNHDIREEKGWSYGVGSGFAFGRGPGAFEAGGGVVTAKTDSALVEFMKHLEGVQGGIPFTDDEMAQGKASLIQSLPRRFSSVEATAATVGSLYTLGLPPTYYQDYASHVNAVTKDDLVRVAKKYIDLAHLNIVIVGDRSVIEAPLRATNIAPIVLLDGDAKPVATP